MNTGIDYGKYTGANRNKDTGIRYGVISQNSIGEMWFESAEPNYGKPHCPECSAEIGQLTDEIVEHHPEIDGDYFCGNCRKGFESQSVFPDEPLGWSLDDGEYRAADCLDFDVILISSPYFTHAQFCSPCVPGAGNLNNPLTAYRGAPKVYAWGPEWFLEGLPYDLYSVDTGEKIASKGDKTLDGQKPV